MILMELIFAYVATKDEREATWSRVRSYVGSEAQLILVVSGNKCTLTQVQW